VPIVLKSGSLNLLENSGPVKVCHGIALPLPASTVMSAQLVLVEVTAIKYRENNKNEYINFAVLCPPKTIKKNIFLCFKKQAIYVERNIEARSYNHRFVGKQ
jgi:hypothetical protein